MAGGKEEACLEEKKTELGWWREWSDWLEDPGVDT
jgi:hypothetical protein